jgi:hypothetical protein
MKMKLQSIDLTDMRSLLSSINLEESDSFVPKDKFMRTYHFLSFTLSGKNRDSSKQLGIALYTKPDFEKIKTFLTEKGYEVKVKVNCAFQQGALARSIITVMKLQE